MTDLARPSPQRSSARNAFIWSAVWACILCDTPSSSVAMTCSFGPCRSFFDAGSHTTSNVPIDAFFGATEDLVAAVSLLNLASRDAIEHLAHVLGAEVQSSPAKTADHVVAAYAELLTAMHTAQVDWAEPSCVLTRPALALAVRRCEPSGAPTASVCSHANCAQTLSLPQSEPELVAFAERELPGTSAECAASALTEAVLAARCTCQEPTARYEFSAEYLATTSAAERAQLEAQLVTFARGVAQLQAHAAELQLLLHANKELEAALERPLTAFAEQILDAPGAVGPKLRASCALGSSLPDAAEQLSTTRQWLEARKKTLASLSSELTHALTQLNADVSAP